MHYPENPFSYKITDTDRNEKGAGIYEKKETLTKQAEKNMAAVSVAASGADLYHYL